ncbi:unnamed protein product [Clonostachys rosea]|uniref:Uncharacterized protein n=1 Tax=Bionectria ochroleuca TaxID=29856 RepID=A0ABY6V3G0_BIOOC|nr:unnamed protein product [Clonostachys rosea]
MNWYCREIGFQTRRRAKNNKAKINSKRVFDKCKQEGPWAFNQLFLGGITVPNLEGLLPALTKVLPKGAQQAGVVPLFDFDYHLYHLGVDIGSPTIDYNVYQSFAQKLRLEHTREAGTYSRAKPHSIKLLPRRVVELGERCGGRWETGSEATEKLPDDWAPFVRASLNYLKFQGNPQVSVAHHGRSERVRHTPLKVLICTNTPDHVSEIKLYHAGRCHNIVWTHADVMILWEACELEASNAKYVAVTVGEREG